MVWDLWAQLTEVLSLPIVINNDKSQESFYDYGSFYEYFMELGRKGLTSNVIRVLER
jgi:hypothetical protein